MKRKLFLILLCAIAAFCFDRDTDCVYTVETTLEHQMIPEKDTLQVRHYNKVGERFYMAMIDGSDRWVDNVVLLKKENRK